MLFSPVKVLTATSLCEKEITKQNGDKTMFKWRTIQFTDGCNTISGEIQGTLAEAWKNYEFSQVSFYSVDGNWKSRSYDDKDGNKRFSNEFIISKIGEL